MLLSCALIVKKFVEKESFIISFITNISTSAAERCGTIMIVSSFAQVSLEDIVREAPNAKLWMQLYLFKDRRNTENLVRRAEKLGVKALVLTVDSPCFGMCDRGFTDEECTVPDFTVPRR